MHRHFTTAIVLIFGVILTGCSGTSVPEAPPRPEEPVVSTVTLEVPGMT